MTRFTRKDNIWLSYKGKQHYVSGSESLGRTGTLSPATIVLHLENGMRILSVHFLYGLAEVPGNSVTWWLKVLYSQAPLHGLVYNTNPFLKLVPKSETAFTGAYIPVSLVWPDDEN